MEVSIKFTWDGFAHIGQKDFINILNQVGYSGTAVRKLLKDKAIKILDTTIADDGEHFRWVKRTVKFPELVEPNDIFYVGRSKTLTITPAPFAWYELAYYHLRDYMDKLKELIRL